MSHTFLLEEGRWTFKGHWLERQGLPVPIAGKTLIAWGQQSWFTWVTRLEFPQGEHPQITLQYRGHLDLGDRFYNFVLQHSTLGRVEGEGWIAPDSIVQQYQVISEDDRQSQRRNGFESLHRLDAKTYLFSGGTFVGPALVTTMEATLQRQG